MKKSTIICLLALVATTSAQAQISSGVSRPKAFHIVKEVKPPILDIVKGSLKFVDGTGNNAIDANEPCSIHLEVTNSGLGDGYGCSVRVSAKGTTQDLTYNQSTPLNMLKVGATQAVNIPVKAGIGTADGQVEFAVEVYEPNGFGTDPQYITVNTRAFEAPKLQVTDYTVTGVSSTLTKKQPFDLQVLLQNMQYGTAENVRVALELPANVTLYEGNANQSFPTIDGGKTRSLVYSLIVNNNYTASTIPITIRVSEKHGKYAESRTIDLALNQTLSSDKIIVGEVLQQRDKITVASLTSDVDRNIPLNPADNANTFAVIIANENYRREPHVAYALSDGEVFRQYCTRTLGIPEKNVRYSPDATLNEIHASVRWLGEVAAAYTENAKIIFYYAGHGIPDERNKSAYLLPTDGFGTDPQTGYKLSFLYDRLSKMPVESVIVFMDACFSGAQRSGEMLASARGVAIKAREESPAGNMIVFSAAQGDETAFPYIEQNHGMFTYFLLKKLQDSKGNVTLGELSDYITRNVHQRSIVENSKKQVPSVTPSPNMSDWKTRKL